MSSLSLALPWAQRAREPGGARGGARFETREPMSIPDDAHLVTRIAEGDREAFRLFYERYAGRLLAYVRAIGRQREPGGARGGARFETREPMSIPDDAHLVTRIAEGDREAFRLFYERYAGRLLAYVRAIGRQREVAEDVVQEVFLSVWRKAESYRRDRGDVPGWLYTITRNRLVDRWRRRGGAQGMVEASDFDFDALATPEPGAESKIVDLSVRKALAGLSADQRQALELAYFGGLTYEETATRLALPVGTLKSRIRAGLARMREILSESSPSEGPRAPDEEPA